MSKLNINVSIPYRMLLKMIKMCFNMFDSSLHHGDWSEVLFLCVSVCFSCSPGVDYGEKLFNGYSVLHRVVACDGFTPSDNFNIYETHVCTAMKKEVTWYGFTWGEWGAHWTNFQGCI